MLFSNQQEAIKEFVKNGPYSEVFPADYPEKAIMGYIGTKTVNNEEVDFCAEWPIFDKPLEPTISLVDAEELMQFVINNLTVIKCDNPRQLLIGFALYDEKQGTAIIKRCRISAVKQLMSKFLIFDDKINSNQENSLCVDSRMEEARALLLTANNQCLRELILK